MKSKQQINFADAVTLIENGAKQTHHQGKLPNQTKIKALYTAEDIKNLPHLNSLPGAAPFLRGPYKTMYTEKPWTIRQYAGFADADDTNRLFRDALVNQKRLIDLGYLVQALHEING